MPSNQRNRRRNEQPTQLRRPRARRNRGPAKKPRTNTGSPYAAMIADPCNATLLPGIYGDQEGLLARVKTTISNRTPATTTCGYLLWSPDYFCNAAGEGVTTELQVANVFGWASSDPTLQPHNDNIFNHGYGQQLDVFGPGTGNATAGSFHDPGGPLLSSDIVMDARSIGACMKLTYTGSALYAGGQWAKITSLPLTSVLNGVPTVGRTPSVDDFFAQATDFGRLGLEPIDIVARPDDSSNVFRSVDEGPMTLGDVSIPGHEVSTYTAEAETLVPQWFGIAWRGLPTDQASPMVFDLIKTIEWRPEPTSGFTQVPKRSIHDQSQVRKATTYLDHHHPGWATRPQNASTFMNDVMDVGKDLAEGAFGFGKAYAATPIGQAHVRRNVLQYGKSNPEVVQAILLGLGI